MLAVVAEISFSKHLLIINGMFRSVIRSPSITTMRDIDPKLPAARHNPDGYPMSDGDWPSNDRYVSIRRRSHQQGCDGDA